MSKHFTIELLFKALSDRTRLRIINLIRGDEICVCFLVEVLQMNQPKVSRHLAYLRKAKVVAARREGKWMHYRIVESGDPHAARIFREVLTSLANDPEMQRDRARLNHICTEGRMWEWEKRENRSDKRTRRYQSRNTTKAAFQVKL